MRKIKPQIWFAFKCGLWLCLLMLATSCQMSESASENLSDSEKITDTSPSFFSIHLFGQRNPAIPKDFDPRSDENGWKDLLDVDLDQSDFIIYEDDIKFYDWSLQKITLEGDAGKRFASEQPEPYGYSFFVIALDGTPVIGGGILSESNAVRMNIPILYIPDPIHSEPFELHLRSETGITNPTPSFPIIEQSVSSEIRRRFLEMGKLIE